MPGISRNPLFRQIGAGIGFFINREQSTHTRTRGVCFPACLSWYSTRFHGALQKIWIRYLPTPDPAIDHPCNLRFSLTFYRNVGKYRHDH